LKWFIIVPVPHKGLTADLLASFPCKINTFRKRVKNVATSRGIVVGNECEYVE
jgi:hypothetical protein